MGRELAEPYKGKREGSLTNLFVVHFCWRSWGGLSLGMVHGLVRLAPSSLLFDHLVIRFVFPTPALFKEQVRCGVDDPQL